MYLCYFFLNFWKSFQKPSFGYFVILSYQFIHKTLSQRDFSKETPRRENPKRFPQRDFPFILWYSLWCFSFLYRLCFFFLNFCPLQRTLLGLGKYRNKILNTLWKSNFFFFSNRYLKLDNTSLRETIEEQGKIIEDQEYKINKIETQTTKKNEKNRKPIVVKISGKRLQTTESASTSQSSGNNEVKKTGSKSVSPAKKKKIAKVNGKFKCSDCNTSFERSDHLQSHQKTHEIEKNFKCPSCNYSCKFQHRLTKHVATVHEGVKGLKCPVEDCPKQYVTAYRCDLKKHIQRYH